MKINKILIACAFIVAVNAYINFKILFENLSINGTLYFSYILALFIAVSAGLYIIHFFTILNKKRNRKFLPSETNSKYIYHSGDEKIEVFERDIEKR